MGKRSGRSRHHTKSTQGEHECWVVLYCDSDDSHVLVGDTDIIYESTLHIGDEVRFSFPQCGLLDGVVKGISSDYSAMVKLQDELNRSTKPKRTESFHDDRPRSAAVKAKQTLSSWKPTQLKPSAIQSANSSSRSPIYTDSDSSESERGNVSDINDDDSLSEGVSPEEEEQLRKIMAKRKNLDMKSLKSIQKQTAHHKPTPSQDKSVEHQSRAKSPIASGVKDVTGSRCQQNESGGTDQPDERRLTADNNPDTGVEKNVNGTTIGKDAGANTPVRRAKKRRSTTNALALQLDGEFFNYKSTDPGVIKLVEEYDVFFLPKDKKNAKKCTSATSLARFLFRVVFTEEAISQCSVSGKPSKNALTKAVERRPALNQDGVEAILDFVEGRCSRKNWPFVASNVKQSVGNMMCEKREAERLRLVSSIDE